MCGQTTEEQKCGQKNGSKRNISHKVRFIFSDAAAIFQLLLFQKHKKVKKNEKRSINERILIRFVRSLRNRLIIGNWNQHQRFHEIQSSYFSDVRIEGEWESYGKLRHILSFQLASWFFFMKWSKSSKKISLKHDKAKKKEVL